MGKLLGLDLFAVPASVTIARSRVLAVLAERPVDREAVALAVSEAVANAALHAYRFDASPGRVRVRVDDVRGAVEVSVSDDGVGLLPRPDSPGAGLGIQLMSRTCDRLDIDGPPGTRVVMRFASARVAARGIRLPIPRVEPFVAAVRPSPS